MTAGRGRPQNVRVLATTRANANADGWLTDNSTLTERRPAPGLSGRAARSPGRGKRRWRTLARDRVPLAPPMASAC
jgi:hypothetical protein